MAHTYLADCISFVERKSVPLVTRDGAYPTVHFRLYAAWLFSRSDVYCDLVGTASHGLSLENIDRELMALCIEASEELEQRLSEAPSSAPPVSSPPSDPPSPLDAPDLLLSLAWVAGQAAARLAPKPKRGSASRSDDAALLDEELAQLERLQREADGDTSWDAEDMERRFLELEERARSSGGTD